MKKIIATIIFMSLLLLPLMATDLNLSKVGQAGAQFLKINVSPRGEALGGAYSAVPGGADAQYWNPAGIARISKMSFYISDVEWIADLRYNYLGFAMPITGMGAFGIQLAFLTMGEMEKTTLEEPEGTGETFTAGDIMMGVTYAHNFTNKFSVGFAAKYIQEHISDATASTIVFDIGTLYNTGFRSLRIGMNMTNFGGEMQYAGGLILVDALDKWEGNYTSIDVSYLTTPYAVPLIFRFGVSYNFIEDNSNVLMGSIENIQPSDGNTKVAIGFEYSYEKTFYVRLGYLYDMDKADMYTILNDNGNVELDDEGLPIDYDIANRYVTVGDYVIPLENYSVGAGFVLPVQGMGLIGLDYTITDLGFLGLVHRVGLDIRM